MVHFNVGGQAECTTLLSTLCLAENSMLSSWVSGRWEPLRDEHGRLFVDVSPDLFLPLIECLRLMSIDNPQHPSVCPMVSADRMPAFRRLADYYGLADLFWPVRWRTVQVCRKDSVEINGRSIATTTPNGYSFSTVSTCNHRQGTFHVRLNRDQELESVLNGGAPEDLFRFGICTANVLPDILGCVKGKGKGIKECLESDWNVSEILAPNLDLGAFCGFLDYRSLVWEVSLRIQDGGFWVTYKLGDFIRECPPLQLPADKPIETWRMFVATTYSTDITYVGHY